MSVLGARAFLSVTVAMALVAVDRVYGAGEDRIWITASINGKHARLYFDTGACDLELHSQGATRLGLNFIAFPKSGTNSLGIPVMKAGDCDFDFGQGVVKMPFFVADLPDTINPTEDGSIGWQTKLFSQAIAKVDAASANVSLLKALPASIGEWTAWNIRTNDCIVGLEFPGQRPEASFINIDTGSSAGVMLSPSGWRRWTALHQTRARTLNAYYTKGSGLVVAEESWAGEISLGRLALRDVPVMEADATDVALSGPGFNATLGLAALRCIDLIIDGKNSIAYTRLNKVGRVAYTHNRLGAVFIPEASVFGRGEHLVARVAADSPAFLAGIRDGDALLKYNDLDVSAWRTQPALIPNFRGSSNGGLLHLTLKRAEKTFQITVELKPILRPEASGPAEKP